MNRCVIFVDNVDRQHFHDLLCEAMSRQRIAVHAYVFMGNHVHLLLTTPKRNALSYAMRDAGHFYVQAFNHRHGRSGTLWQSHFKSCLVESDRYLMVVYRYIELNPIRAAMVEWPEQHRWSSIHANVGLLQDDLVTPHPTFLAIDCDPVRRSLAYQTWLSESISDDELQRIRSHIQQQRALGDITFQAKDEKALGRPARGRPRGRSPQSRANPDWD